MQQNKLHFKKNLYHIFICQVNIIEEKLNCPSQIINILKLYSINYFIDL
jgi:hypothetical protein